MLDNCFDMSRVADSVIYGVIYGHTTANNINIQCGRHTIMTMLIHYSVTSPHSTATGHISQLRPNFTAICNSDQLPSFASSAASLQYR